MTTKLERAARSFFIGVLMTLAVNQFGLIGKNQPRDAYIGLVIGCSIGTYFTRLDWEGAFGRKKG